MSDLIVALVVVTVVSTWGVIGWSHAYREAKLEGCGSNLNQLTKAMYNYSLGKTPQFSTATGSETWKRLHRDREIGFADVLWCPIRGRGAVGETHFRGPARDPNELTSREPFGCDDPGNHPDHWPINAVLVSTQVIRVERGTPEFERVMEETAP